MRDAVRDGPLYVSGRPPTAPHAPSDRASHGGTLAGREALRRNQNAAGQNWTRSRDDPLVNFIRVW